MAQISAVGAKGHHTFTLTVDETSTDTGSNTSTVHIKFTLYSSSYTWKDWGTKISYSVSVNGTVYSGSIPNHTKGNTDTLVDTYLSIGHNDDGSKAIGFSFSVSDKANQYYTCGDASASGSMNLTTIARYANITDYRIVSKTETSITHSITVDTNCSDTFYKIAEVQPDGSYVYGAWVSMGSCSGGATKTHTITGLRPYQRYVIGWKCRRADSGLDREAGGAISDSTYNYPYCKTSPDFQIGEEVTLTLYNPLNRQVTVTGIGNGDATIFSGSTNQKSITMPNDNTTIDNQYQSIPNASMAFYKVNVTYGSHTEERENGNVYYVDPVTNAPTFTDYEYKDSNTDITSVTGNNQVFVKGYSTIQVKIPSANKMVAKNYATPSSYHFALNDLMDDVNYSNNDITVELGTVNSLDNTLRVLAYDSRTIDTLVTKQLTIYDYTKPVVNLSVSRLNDFEDETTLKISGTYTKLTIDNVNKNTITNVKYRYKEKGTNNWSNWANVNTTVNNGSYTCSDVILSLDNTKAFDFEVQVTDNIDNNTNTIGVNVGVPIFFISSNMKACYINGQEILMYDVVDTW